MPNYNVVDAGAQEKIRRGPHEFTVVDGRQQYVSRPHTHQEYPKIMDSTPPPKAADFKGKPDMPVLLEAAMKEWESQVTASIVHNKTEEAAWLKRNERRAS